jgi:hypothetical protein
MGRRGRGLPHSWFNIGEHGQDYLERDGFSDSLFGQSQHWVRVIDLHLSVKVVHLLSFAFREFTSMNHSPSGSVGRQALSLPTST